MSKLNLLNRLWKLTETDRILIDSVRRFSRETLPEYLTTGKYSHQPKELYRHMGSMGILGATLPEPYGSSLKYQMYGRLSKELEYIDSGFRSMYSVQNSLVMGPIFKYGSTLIQEKYLPGLATGEMVGCFGLTEPNSGSDASTMKTIAVKSGDHFVLSGNKTWITNAPIADVMIVWAKLHDTIGGFVIDRSMPGVSTTEITDKMSLMNSPTGMIHLDQVSVPKTHQLQVVGMRGPFSCLNDARLGISIGVMGAAEACIDIALEYGESRTLFGTSLAEKQLFQTKLADMTTEYNLGLLAGLTVAAQVDAGESIPPMISLVKRNNCAKALDISRISRDILGGNGISHHYNIFRHLLNLETVNTYEGTYDIHGLILGNYLTGKKAF